MKLTTPILAAAAVTVGALLALASPIAASAHISVDAPSTAAGSSTVLTFALPHGCDASSTTSISIDIPEGVVGVTPTVNPGWSVSTTVVEGARAIDLGDGTIPVPLESVLYTADTPFPDGLRTTFALSAAFPADAAGETFEFPILQTCEIGETNWNETTVDGEDEPAHPAPAITVTAATGDEHGHGTSETESVATHDEGVSTTAASADDVLARILGAGGLVVGAVGIVLAVTARRKQSV